TRVLYRVCIAPTPTQSYTLSLHDALPIFGLRGVRALEQVRARTVHERGGEPGQGALRHELQVGARRDGLEGREIPFERGLRLRRSEEHTSELQSRENLVCRLLLEKKKTAR